MVKDVRFTDEGEIFATSDGDFASTPSDTRHVQDIIESFVGWWKEFPATGVGINRFKNSSGSEQKILRESKLQLKADGYRIDKVIVKGSQLYISGKRKDESN
jgi:hypothetical protein